MKVDISSILNAAVESYGSYMTLEQLSSRWHTAPTAISQAIKDKKIPGIAISSENGMRTKYIIPTISIMMFEISLGTTLNEKSNAVDEQ